MSNKYSFAVDDPDTPFSHVAFTWDTELEGWTFLCAGRTADEFEHRVAYWISRGADPDRIRKYVCTPPATTTQAEPQAIEGESWGEWVGRLRAAQNRITAENMGNPQIQAFAASEPQPQPISEELWAVIKDRRPGVYATLQHHGICNVSMTVGVSRTKLYFPDCRDMSYGKPGWMDFDLDIMNSHSPCIVLDGTPENGFKPISWLHGLSGTK